MRALVPTAKTDDLVVIDDVPEVATSDDQALVAVEAFSVNRGETFLLEKPRPGWRPGKDVAGVVVEAAPDGSGPDVGRRVVAHPPAAGWAERVAVPTAAIAVLPDTVDVLTAAALPLAGLTAMRLLDRSGPVLGRRVLITGASGGVGHYLVELAAAAGAEITAVSASTSRCPAARPRCSRGDHRRCRRARAVRRHHGAVGGPPCPTRFGISHPTVCCCGSAKPAAPP